MMAFLKLIERNRLQRHALVITGCRQDVRRSTCLVRGTVLEWSQQSGH